MLNKAIFPYCLALSAFLSAIEVEASVVVDSIYSVNFADASILKTDPITGATTVIAHAPGTVGTIQLSAITVANSSTAYTVDLINQKVYTVDLVHGTTSVLATLPNVNGHTFNPATIVAADSNTLYAVGYTTGGIAKIDTATGNVTVFATLPVTGGLTGFALNGNNTIGYAVSESTHNIYAVNTVDGTFSLVSSIPAGLTPNHTQYTALNPAVNPNIVYTANNRTPANIYSLDLTTGNFSTVGTIAGNPGLQGFAPFNATTIYMMGDNNNNLYVFNPITGTYSILTTLPGHAADADGPAILMKMDTSNLQGNSASLANYLNNNASMNTIALYIPVSANDFNNSLQATAPTRNAFVTFAAQNAYLASSQVLVDHLRQNTLQKKLQKSAKIAFNELPEENFVAVANNSFTKQNTAPKENLWSTWITPFAEFTTAQQQHQTQGFQTQLGGAVAGIEYNGVEENTFGFGLGYVFTYMHANQHAGSANINQGFLSLYGSTNVNHWYLDYGVWGSYYNADNTRYISFTGYNGTAKSTIDGLQVAPHLEIGYDYLCCSKWINCSRFGVEPFAMGDWVANFQNGFTEQGSTPFNAIQNSAFSSFLRAETGFRFHEVANLSWGDIIFREKGSYAYQKAFNTGHITTAFVGTPGSFTVETLTSAQSLGVVELSMLFVSANPKTPYVDIRYQGEFGAKYQSNQIMFEIGKSF